MLQLINPKAYAVNTTLFSGFAFRPDSFLLETTLKLIILNCLWIFIHLLWLYFGMRLHSLNLSNRTQRVVNISMAGCLMGVVVLSFYSMFGYSDPLRFHLKRQYKIITLKPKASRFALQ